MKPFSPFVFALLSICAVSACSRDNAPTTAAPAAESSAKPSGEVAKIPILPGYKYYIGGPVLAADPYGRYRISKFNDEVQQPPSRGMIFGAKQDGDQLEYRVWGNGQLLGFNKGVMRGGVFWKEYSEAYRSSKLTAREWSVNIDAEKRSKVKIEDIDPENGEVIRTREYFSSYLPPAKPKDVEDDEDDDEAGQAAPAGAAPSTGQAASAPPAEPAKEGAR